MTVSEAVARLLASEFLVTDPTSGEEIVLPRGDVLIHGGDLAYPVATVREMSRRLVAPYNRVLEPTCDWSKPRVLLAVPGNHDWYDGLDGFARLCQAPCTFEEPTQLDEALHPSPNESPVLAWAEAFASGEAVHKPGALAFAGYVPIQHASYFRLPVARGIELFGVDRQLRRVDARQRAFFKSREGGARIVILPDPARAYGDEQPHGAESLAAIDVIPERDPTLVLTGDVHHYERSREGRSVHVVAGGGGAFLHGARIATEGATYERDVEFPGPRASRAMALRLPWHLARGRAGWVITSLFAIADQVALRAYFRDGVHAAAVAATVTSVIVALGTALLVSERRQRLLRVVVLSTIFGLLTGVLPVALGVVIDRAGVDEIGSLLLGKVLAIAVGLALSILASGLAFGAMLATLLHLGWAHAQPYAALGQPGFKHFVRMRVREPLEGASSVELFVVGVVDPVRGSSPVLVDRFSFTPEGFVE